MAEEFVSVQPYANGKPAAINTFTKYIYELTPENELGERLDNKISDIEQNIQQNTQDIESLRESGGQTSPKIEVLWDAVFTDITANPFLIVFTSLDGVTVTAGNYNEALDRLEC